MGSQTNKPAGGDSKNVSNKSDELRRQSTEQIGLINETSSAVLIGANNEHTLLMPDDSIVIGLAGDGSLKLGDNISIQLHEEGVEVVDPQACLAGLGPEALEKSKIAAAVDFAFALVPPGEGDCA